MMINDLEGQIAAKSIIRDSYKEQEQISKRDLFAEKSKLEDCNQEVNSLTEYSAKLENQYKSIIEQIDQINSEIKDQDKLILEEENKIKETEMLKNKALNLEKTIIEKYNSTIAEEKKVLDDVVRSETFNFLLKENIHSFSLFKDYFSETENTWYDSHIKIEKFHDISIERIDPEEVESRQRIRMFSVDTILYDNMFKYYMTATEYIKQRLAFLFNYIWKEKKLWSNSRENKVKIVMILLNRSYDIFEGIMETIQKKIINHNGSYFDINLYSCTEDRNKIKELKSINLALEESKSNSMKAQSSIRKLIGSELEAFFLQNDYRVLECEIKVYIDSLCDMNKESISEEAIDGTISFSIFLVKPSVDTITCLGRKLENLNQSYDKKKIKGSSIELSKDEESEVRDFKVMFDILNNESPLSFNFVDYRNLVDDVEGPMTEEDKELVSKYLKVQEEFSKIKVSNTRSFLEKIVQFQ